MNSSLFDKFKKTLKSKTGAKLVDFTEITETIESKIKKNIPQVIRELKPEKSLLPKDYKLTEITQAAYDALESSVPIVFLTGRAGTGKTTFIQYVRSNLGKNIVIVAPTGIAAINVAGQTIHSFFKFPPRAFNSNEIKSGSSAKTVG